MKDIKTVYTHGSIFHADDVFSTALLLMINPELIVNRVMKVPEGVFAYDIGYGPYDHHQKDKEYRTNGVPYAAFGLLWRDFGAQASGLTEESLKKFDEDFVQPLDAHDNGVGDKRNSLCVAIAAMNPNWNEPADEAVRYTRFMEAVGMAKTILSYEFRKFHALEEAHSLAVSLKANPGDGIAVLDQYVDIMDELAGGPIYAVVCPSLRGGYQMQLVPDTPGSFATMKHLPKEWCGERPEALPEGIHFVHPTGFLSGADTVEAAVWLARQAV